MPVMWLVMSQPIAREQLPGHRAGGDAGGGFTRAGALEHVANVVVIVLERAGEIGVTRTRPHHRRAIGAGRAGRRLRLDVHRVLPVLPILVANEQRDRRAGGLAAAHARQELRAIGFDRHAPAAAVAALAAAQLERDGIEIDRQSGGQPFEDRDETLSVRFTGRQKTQHPSSILYEEIATPGRRARADQRDDRADSRRAFRLQ